jgi:two-component system sensor histidine kinase BaeS
LGKTVGWLGLASAPQLSHPLDIDFIQKQSRAFYIIGGGILLFSVLVAGLLAKHILKPIRRLTEGTRTLAKRNFKTRISVTSSDELGQLADDFNAMAHRLEGFEKRQKQWLADISHELRTPLSVLVGEIEAIQDGIRKPDAKSLRSLHNEVSRITSIVNELRDLSLAEIGALSLIKVPIQLHVLLPELISRFQNRCEPVGLKIIFKSLNEKRREIEADVDRLTQLFTNLMENSLRYTDKPGTLKIHYQAQLNYVTISFEDTGPGVPPESIPRLFDRLYRVDPVRNPVSDASGLGLSICKAIVESHGGSIRALNGPLGGLRIEIDLHCTRVS